MNTLIQCIHDLRRLGGRVVVFLCTNRLSVLDAALQRRAAIVRKSSVGRMKASVDSCSPWISRWSSDPSEHHNQQPGSGDRRAATGGPRRSTSDIRTRLYRAAIASAFPSQARNFEHLKSAADSMRASPVMEDA